MKYRLTPFHLPTIYFIGQGIYVLYKHLKLDNYDSLELGALEPFLLIGLGLAFLIGDFIIQLTVGLTIKINPRKTIYLIEFAVLTIILCWYWRTFYPTIQKV